MTSVKFYGIVTETDTSIGCSGKDKKLFMSKHPWKSSNSMKIMRPVEFCGIGTQTDTYSSDVLARTASYPYQYTRGQVQI